MGVKILVALIGIVGISTGLPVSTPEQNGPQPYVSGVFLSAEAFKSLQDRANSNERPQVNEPRNLDQSAPLRMNQEQQVEQSKVPQNYGVQTQQVLPANQQPMTQQVPQQQIYPQPVVLQNQPLTQPQIVQQNQPLLAQPQQQQYVVAQPNQQPVYISQQPNPIVVAQQPGQGLVYQSQQPTYIASVPQNGLIANPINNQPMIAKPINVNPVQNQGSYYAMVPVNGQNTGNVGGTYLLPVQQVPSTPILVSAGK